MRKQEERLASQTKLFADAVYLNLGRLYLFGMDDQNGERPKIRREHHSILLSIRTARNDNRAVLFYNLSQGGKQTNEPPDDL